MHLSDGFILKSDMIIGADGLHSTVRLSFQEEEVEPRKTGTAAFTGNVPAKSLSQELGNTPSDLVYA